jgi:regulatory protein YycI of two-component signal transduction system YycFG
MEATIFPYILIRASAAKGTRVIPIRKKYAGASGKNSRKSPTELEKNHRAVPMTIARGAMVSNKNIEQALPKLGSERCFGLP